MSDYYELALWCCANKILKKVSAKGGTHSATVYERHNTVKFKHGWGAERSGRAGMFACRSNANINSVVELSYGP
jgi:hypothetical protein